MVEGEGDDADLPDEGRPRDRVATPDRREIHRRLRDMDRRWTTHGDSEALWEQEHKLLIALHAAGDIGAISKLARRAKRARGPRGTAKDLADAALGLWVLERYEEAAEVLRTAVERLPKNRYPYSMLLRHLTWGSDPEEAMAFILSNIDRVPWRAYALVQMATMCVDVANKGLVSRALDQCQEHLETARGYLSEVEGLEDASSELSRTAGRLQYLVETLEKRLGDARVAKAAKDAEGEEVVFLKDGDEKLMEGVREAAEASGVSLEGMVDDDMDLDELERTAKGEPREEDDEDDTVTVLEVTPKRTMGFKRREEGR